MRTPFLTLIFLLIAVSAAAAQGSVEGTITDAKGAAVGGAVVTLIDAEGTTVKQYTTDPEGYYTLDDIEAGTYKLNANAGGFKLATKTNVLVVDDGLTTVDLTLIANAGGSVVKADPWPKPKFSFSVEFTVNGKTSKFYVQEVAGLENVNEIEYRHGNDKVFSTVKTPGLLKAPEVTLKKGNFGKDDTFLRWYDQRLQNVIQHGTVVINLLDETGRATMSWTLTNAFPKKLTGANQALGQFETIVLAHEGLTIKK